MLPVVGAVVGGRYEIVRALGQGGMGAVFEANDRRLGRAVALKVLVPELANDPELRVRFEREARAAALLKSRHVVRVFDIETAPEGFTYIVMEMLAGQDLGRETISRGTLPAGELVRWIVETCHALHEAHQAGIIHRDIKPANVFLAVEGERRIAKVLDFGISKFEEHITRALTRPNDGVLGTPHYMAPELLRGKKIDRRADVWALGVMMFRILSGRWPFDSAGSSSYIAAVVSDPPIALESLRPDLPHELVGVIMRALEKAPGDRFATAADLASALAPFGGVVVESSPRLSAEDTSDTEKMPPPMMTIETIPIPIVRTPSRKTERPPGTTVIRWFMIAVGLATLVAIAFVLVRGTRTTAHRDPPSVTPSLPSAVVSTVPSAKPSESVVSVPSAPPSARPFVPSIAAQRPRLTATATASASASKPALPPDFVPDHL